MGTNKKPVCRYGSKCYRKNQNHLKEYSHPSETVQEKNEDGKSSEGENMTDNTAITSRARGRNVGSSTRPNGGTRSTSPRGNDKSLQAEDKGNLINFTSKRKKGLSTSKSKQDVKKLKKSLSNETVQNEGGKQQSHSEDDTSDTDVKSNSWTYIKAPAQTKAEPTDVPVRGATKEEIIKYYMLVEMPPDFYSFFEFCKSIDQSEPLSVLKPFRLNLVGPFDLLQEGDINIEKKELMLCHWRYFYDPPEFQTVLAAESGFHIGYWRDVPKELPVFLASNNANQDCLFKVEGENIFGAVYQYLTQYQKVCDPFSKTKTAKFQSSLSKWAGGNDFTLDRTTEKIKARQKQINSKTFHGAGIVVPVEKKTQVGYRPLIESDAKVKKICKLIMDADDESERENLMEKLQPLINFANIANDECDFGNSLELGIDLFCMGSPIFHSIVEHLLTTAYSLLNRSEFGDIIRTHLANRRKETNLSIL